MESLVEYKKKEIWAESHLVARKLGVKHGRLIEQIESVLKDFPDILGVHQCTPKQQEKYYIEDRDYRGQKFTCYLMNKNMLSLVLMRMTSKKAREWQRKFNDAFYAMESALLKAQTNKADIEWTSQRVIGKQARQDETETIAKFVEYATEQGSKNAKFYYKHVTNATYKALGLMAQKHPKLRDQMNIYELSSLMLAEKLAGDNIARYMELGRNYKDIYDSVKDDLLAFADAVRPLQQVGQDKNQTERI